MQETTQTQTLIDLAVELARANPTHALWAFACGATVYAIYRIEKSDSDPELQEIRKELEDMKDKSPEEINQQVSLLVKLEMMEFHIKRLETEIAELKGAA